MSQTAEALMAKQQQQDVKEQHMPKDKTPPAKPEQQDVATHYENPFLEAAKESGSEFGQLLKFVKGKWWTGDDEVPQGTEYVAHLPHLMRGWVKFEDNAVVDRSHIGRVADGYKPPPRNELPDADPTGWREKDSDGKPRDPWVPQWFLPLVSVEKGEFVCFVTGSNGGDIAMASLCRVFGHRKDGALPIVATATRSYKHKKYGRIENPVFQIVGWDAPPTGPATPSAPTPVTSPNGKLPPAHGATVEPDDSGDEITFNL